MYKMMITNELIEKKISRKKRNKQNNDQRLLQKAVICEDVMSMTHFS